MKFWVTSNRFGYCKNFHCWNREPLYRTRVFLIVTEMQYANSSAVTCNSTDDTGRLDGQFLKLFGAYIFLRLSLMANVIHVLYTLLYNTIF